MRRSFSHRLFAHRLMTRGLFAVLAALSAAFGSLAMTQDHGIDSIASADDSRPHIVDSLAADETYLTIYPDNIGLVTEVHRLDLPQGRSTLRFLGVSDQIIAQSVILKGFLGVTIERNFDQKLLNKANLVNSAIGQSITLIRVNPATGGVREERARIISAGEKGRGGVVIDIGGSLEALECSGLNEVLGFDGLPDGLTPDPVLSIDVESEAGGPSELIISYLTEGLSWEADYRLDVDKTHSEGALLAWLTLSNETSKSFKNVPTAIIAGTLNRDQNAGGLGNYSGRNFSANCWPQGNTKRGISQKINFDQIRLDRNRALKHFPDTEEARSVGLFGFDEFVVTASRIARATREDVGDYKLYRTPAPVTVASHQTKQVAFIGEDGLDVKRVFVFDHPFETPINPINADVEYRLDNSREGSLGQPLPRGNFRVMTTRDNGRLAYLGEDEIENLPVDVPVKPVITQSVSVLMQPSIEVVATGRGGNALHISGQVFNGTDQQVTAEVKLDDFGIRAADLGQSSHLPDPDEAVPTFPMRVPPGENTEFEVSLPINISHQFNIRNVFYSQKIKDFETETGEVKFGLKGGGFSRWALNAVSDVHMISDVKMDSDIVSFKKAKHEDGSMTITGRARHVIENTARETAHVELISTTNHTLDGFEITDASQAPDSLDPLVWEIELGPRERLTLEYSYSYKT